MPKSQEDLEAQLDLYSRQLARHEPRAVAKACEEWAQSKSFWPSLAELLELVREHEGDNGLVRLGHDRDEHIAEHVEVFMGRLRGLLRTPHPALRLQRVEYDRQMRAFALHRGGAGDAEIARELRA